MTPEDPVDPDAQTLMPAPERDEGRAASGWSAPIQLTADGDEVQGTVVDVSPQGMAVQMPSPLPIDTEVELTLPSDPPSIARARVVWTRAGKGPEPGAVGLEFTELDGDGFEAVESMIEARGAAG
jgi:hypothetical protein